MPRSLAKVTDHLILILGCVVMVGPVALLVVDLLSAPNLWPQFQTLFGADGVLGYDVSLWRMLGNSVLLALGVATLACTLSLLAGFALVFFPLPGREWIFGLMLLAMFFPIETRILPSFAVVHQLGLLNSHAGMVLPIVASGFGVLVFRQFLRQVPKELIEAARLDGAHPMRCLRDIILPISAPMIAALFAIFFVLGWNQYVWPLMLSTTRQDMVTVVSGVVRAGPDAVQGQALALLAMLPPGLVILLSQRWLMRGLTSGIH
ncbi:carbohydrate ABC transporter permease [Tritonibacter scottomollicae]|uniref:sn-glycerol-3-phosphate transport system permease protein UgpE n=1 Tax=Tritonibacter scottomollicae TaxID=483013 RepID=A0ABZ0HJG7_TRISK|nr:carbohydrate ABC transporter permease [Tritonibacter scottomollicae]WOI34398.1 carbohydrate ABC transporter permease [Tritonibacter scottomollicae]